MVKSLPAMQETRVRSLGWRPGLDPWVGKISWRRKWQPAPVFLPEESHGQKSLVSPSPRTCSTSDTTERLTLHFISYCAIFNWKNNHLSKSLWPQLLVTGMPVCTRRYKISQTQELDGISLLSITGPDDFPRALALRHNHHQKPRFTKDVTSPKGR